MNDAGNKGYYKTVDVCKEYYEEKDNATEAEDFFSIHSYDPAQCNALIAEPASWELKLLALDICDTQLTALALYPGLCRIGTLDYELIHYELGGRIATRCKEFYRDICEMHAAQELDDDYTDEDFDCFGTFMTLCEQLEEMPMCSLRKGGVEECYIEWNAFGAIEFVGVKATPDSPVLPIACGYESTSSYCEDLPAYLRETPPEIESSEPSATSTLSPTTVPSRVPSLPPSASNNLTATGI